MPCFLLRPTLKASRKETWEESYSLDKEHTHPTAAVGTRIRASACGGVLACIWADKQTNLAVFKKLPYTLLSHTSPEPCTKITFSLYLHLRYVNRFSFSILGLCRSGFASGNTAPTCWSERKDTEVMEVQTQKFTHGTHSCS